jgi:hypothetical protein
VLELDEVQLGKVFPSDYLRLGNRREQVRMAGKVVTPPAARELMAAVAEALNDPASPAPPRGRATAPGMVGPGRRRGMPVGATGG